MKFLCVALLFFILSTVIIIQSVFIISAYQSSVACLHICASQTFYDQSSSHSLSLSTPKYPSNDLKYSFFLFVVVVDVIVIICLRVLFDNTQYIKYSCCLIVQISDDIAVVHSLIKFSPIWYIYIYLYVQCVYIHILLLICVLSVCSHRYYLYGSTNIQIF